MEVSGRPGHMLGGPRLPAVSQGRPLSFASRLVSAAAARDHACAAFKNAIACTERSTGPLQCSWGISSGSSAFEGGCRSTYLAEWDAFAAQVQRGSNIAVAAQAMGHADSFMCPGSIGHKSMSCSSIYPMDKQGRYIGGICQQGTGCAYQAAHHACAASQPLTRLIRPGPAHRGHLQRRLLHAQPAAVQQGHCAARGAAQGLVRQAAGLHLVKQRQHLQADVWLSKLDQWGQQMLAASQACGVRRSEAACAARGVKAAVRLQPARAAEFLKLDIGTGSPSTKCPV
ncbi:hypothetical protein COO60DRAFT_1638160 [Scenedesmus sp. NREL 46B-D3]|nr:hypothetical protein COO60DRAFT_1638160 [Scenedesmus sp. NREL 46B-D3]